MVTTNRQLTPAVVLVADRTLSARYQVLFEGIFATMQTTQVPQLAMRRFVSRRMPVDADGRAWCAPLGVRRIESSLLADGGLTDGEVVCTTPEALDGLLGPWVKIVGVSSSDPLGEGMSNTTTSSFWKGELYTSFWLDRMMTRIRRAKDEHGFRVLAGGAGAWQYSRHPDRAERQGIDTVFDGYFESAGPDLFRQVLDGREPPRLVREDGCAVDGVRTIRRPSLLGIVELSRGCGNGCRFCTSAGRKMEHLPIDTIVSDLECNVAGGVTAVVSGSEDLFRYGGNGWRTDFERLRELLVAMREVRGLSFMQIDHANVSSIVQLTDDQLREARRLLTWDRPTEYLWVNMGVESANGRLVAANAPGKLGPIDPDDWDDQVRESCDRIIRTGFFPVISVVLGLPGETPDDVARTDKLVEFVGERGGVVFPIFYEPVAAEPDPAERRFRVESMRADHLDLYTRCYEINFRRVPKLFWDNQRAGGVSWLRRLSMQLLGKTEVRSWRRNFKRVRKAIARKSAGPAETNEPQTAIHEGAGG